MAAETIELLEHERPKYWFVSLVMDKGALRVRPLNNQFVPISPGSSKYEAVNPASNVQCDKVKRAKFPVGTVFAVTSLSREGSYYRVGDGGKIFAVTADDSETLPEMKVAYEHFLGGDDDTGIPTDHAFETPPTSDKRRTIYHKISTSEDLAPPTIDKDGYYVDKDLWYLLVRNYKRKENTLILGPTGTGKTEIITFLSQKLDLPINIHDMGAMQDPISGLLGVHRLSSTGESIFDLSPFTKSITNDGIVLLDELSRAPSSANNILFPCLDNRRELPLDIASSKVERSIAVSEETCFFATANLGVEYTGTQMPDRALLDRFFPVEFSYMPISYEVQVLTHRAPSCSRIEAEKICKVANTLRDLYMKAELSTSISTRHTIQCAKLVADGFPLLKSIEYVFTPLFEGTQKEGERSKVYLVISSK